MGISFRPAGCVKIAKVCCIESCAININSSPRYQDQEKPAGCDRRSLITFGKVPPKGRHTVTLKLLAEEEAKAGAVTPPLRAARRRPR
jgi:hypothetical protein